MNRTLIFYNKNAKQFVEQTVKVDMQLLYTPFIDSLPSISSRKQYILDLGCGSGRDSLYFANQDFNVTAIDGSQNLIELAKIHSKNNNNCKDNIEWLCLPFSQLNEQNWHDKYTGIWACASLLHIPYVELSSVINILLDMLTTDGVIYASFKYGDKERTEKDRFFCDLNEQRWARVKALLDRPIDDTVWINQDRRVDRNYKWLNILIRPF